MAKTSTVDACAACGKKEETSVCGRCEKVSYCGSACQKTHWKSHKATCQLSLENIACCDVCKVREKELSWCARFAAGSTAVCASRMPSSHHSVNYVQNLQMRPILLAKLA